MKTIYIDRDFKCHLTPSDSETYVEMETDAFDNFAPEVVEGYRFVPDGESWTREDGAVFAGEMVAPWRDSQELDAIQHEYERARTAEYAAALEELGVVIE